MKTKKKIIIASICCGSFVGAAGIAVGSVFLSAYLNNKESIDITAPDGLNISNNQTIHIVAFIRYSHQDHVVHWQHDSIPFEYIKFNPEDNTLELSNWHNTIKEKSSFHIWATDGGVTSNKLTINVNPTPQTIDLSFNDIDTLSTAGDRVKINASFSVPPNDPNTQWHYSLPNSAIIVESSTTSYIIFKALLDMPESTSFTVSAENDGVSSYALTIKVVEPTTTIDLTYGTDFMGNLNHNLSFKYTEVIIVANITHQNGHTIQWIDPLPTGFENYVNVIKSNNTIKFKMIENVPDTFANMTINITCACNGVQRTLPIFTQGIDHSSGQHAPIELFSSNIPQEVINADGIVYQNGEFIQGANSIKCPAWKPGTLIYKVPNIYDDSGTSFVMNPNRINYDFTSDQNPPGINMQRINVGENIGALEISWSAGGWDLEIYKTCVLRFTVEYDTSSLTGNFSGDISNQVILNIDFGNITGVQFTDPSPVTTNGLVGSAIIEADVVGDGIMDDHYYDLEWKIEKIGTFDDSKLNFVHSESGRHERELRLQWNYQDNPDLTAQYKIIAESKTDPTQYATKIFTIIARQTVGITINAPNQANVDISKSGSIDLSATYDGSHPSTDTTWEIVDYDTTPSTEFSISNNGAPNVKLNWSSTAFAVARNYNIVIRAKSTHNSQIFATKQIIFHNRGIPTDINVSGGTGPGDVSTQVIGDNITNNVDDSVTFSLKITKSSGQPTTTTLTGTTNKSTHIECEEHGYGHGEVWWDLTITTKNLGNVFSKTISGYYYWNNYIPSN